MVFFTGTKRTIRSLLVASIVTAGLVGCGKGGSKIPGIKDFKLSVEQSNLYVAFVATVLKLDAGLTVPIAGMDDSYLSMTPDLNSSGTVFAFTVSIASLLNNGAKLPLSGLPDGRAIPDIDDGELPRLDFEAGRLNLTLYLSDEVFGLFVPLNLVTRGGLTIPWTISATIRDSRGNRLGKIYALPPGAEGTGSGILILLPFNGQSGQTRNLK